MPKTGRAGRPGQHKFKVMNQPPKDTNWAWFTREMLEAPAWQALPITARQVIDRIIVEHLKHGGKENGNLVITFQDFQDFGIRRPMIQPSIRLAVSLGWIQITENGVKGHGIARRPTRYSLAWLPRADWTPPTNRWKAQPKDTIAMALNTFNAARKHANKKNSPGSDARTKDPIFGSDARTDKTTFPTNSLVRTPELLSRVCLYTPQAPHPTEPTPPPPWSTPVLTDITPTAHANGQYAKFCFKSGRP